MVKLSSNMEMDEDQQANINLIGAWLKEAFLEGAFYSYARLKLLRWAGEHMDVYTNKIRQQEW